MINQEPLVGSPVMRTRGLNMSYGANHVLRGIDLDIGRGEVVVLLGPNGAGKTTTVEILEGFRKPSSGVVEVLGADPLTAGDEWRARVGIVLQSWRDHPKWRVRELLDYLGGFYVPYSGDVQRPWSSCAVSSPIRTRWWRIWKFVATPSKTSN